MVGMSGPEPATPGPPDRYTTSLRCIISKHDGGLIKSFSASFKKAAKDSGLNGISNVIDKRFYIDSKNNAVLFLNILILHNS